ncbi:MAG: N-acetylmuramoyl-L-alanine amidase [Anaerolineae bacterium]|nr:N-acetylmuramoyl-L-alanine amidase [Anaerolineae bacterium]
MTSKKQVRLTRREFLVVSTLAAGAIGGLCGVGGLAGTLLLARRFQKLPTSTPPDPTITTAPILAPPAIVAREAWGARPINHAAENEKGIASPTNPNGWYVYTGDLATIYRTVAIHHSYPIRRDTGTMRDIQNLHIDTQKWADIAYHFGIDGKGIIYAGRDIQARGASVAGHNTGTIGVVLIGDFQQETPATAQLSSLQTLVKWLTLAYHLTHLAGHYEFNSETVCPGTYLRPYLDGLARQAGLQRGTGGYVPPTNNLTPNPTKSCC